MPTPREVLATINPEAILLDGHDSAIVGIVWVPDRVGPVAMYDDDLLIDSLLDQNPGWNFQDATEWIESSVDIGPHSPTVVEFFDEGDLVESTDSDVFPDPDDDAFWS